MLIIGLALKLGNIWETEACQWVQMIGIDSTKSLQIRQTGLGNVNFDRQNLSDAWNR